MCRRPSQAKNPRVPPAEDAEARRLRVVAAASSIFEQALMPKLSTREIRARASDPKTLSQCPILRPANPMDPFAQTQWERKGKTEPFTPHQSVHRTPTHMPVLKMETLFLGRSHADIDRCCADAPRSVTPRELLERVDELAKTLDDNVIDLEF